MVEVGGQITKCSSLNMVQNLICLVIGSFEMIWGIVIKLTPLKLWQFYSLDEPVEAKADETNDPDKVMAIGITED
jgi:hypothetical protein